MWTPEWCVDNWALVLQVSDGIETLVMQQRMYMYAMCRIYVQSTL